MTRADTRLITAAKEALARGQQNPASITFWTEHLPPSTNQLYANVAGKGRVKSERYIQWQNAAGWDFQRGHISGPFTAEIIICLSRRNKRRDLDNFAKPTMDLLVKQGVVDDDSLCEELTLRWAEAAGGMRVIVAGIVDVFTAAS